MITYDVDYNLIEGYTLEQCFNNSEELKKYEMPQNNLSVKQVNDLLHKISPSLWCQFRIAEFDDSQIDAYGCPELLNSMNLAEWVYE